MEVYIFGDQTADCRSFLTKVFHHRGSLLLDSFLAQAAQAIRQEIADREHGFSKIPDFGTIQELTDRYYKQETTDPAIESTIVCLSQLAHFIGHFEEQTIKYPTASRDVRLVGLCTGLLGAAAVASSNSLIELIPRAVEVLRLAFRAGSCVSTVAERFGGNVGKDSWSTIVVGDTKSAQAALDRFHADKGISPMSRLWISATSNTSITISGPPAIKERFFETQDYLPKSARARAMIYGPYHASHLFSNAHIDRVLRPETEALFSNSSTVFPVISSTTGKPIASSDGYSLLKSCLQEILLEPLHWDQVLKNCSESEASGAKIFAVGPTSLTPSMLTALKANGRNVEFEDSGSWGVRKTTGPKAMSDAPIAIVGMAGRFPDAANHDAFWENLEKGLDLHREVPPDRYNVKTHTDPAGKVRNTSHTPYGNFIKDPGLFDARFFNMSPREAAQTDPMQRLMLVTAYEAMEMAGIVPGRTPSTKRDRIGTFYGQTSDDWREINAAQDIDTYFISGGVRAFGPGRLNYFFKWSGPSFSVDTACSSSFAALNIACTSLRAGECDTAFSGGANVLTNPDIFCGLSRGHFLSQTGSCKTFDDTADGYCRGDGVCTIILKRLDDAIADNDPILGVIKGTGTNHSADAVSITHPCAKDQAFLFSKVLAENNVDAHDISYVEMHGTGTQAGDGIEMESVTSVFAPRSRRRREDQPLYLGAVKANIGHGEAVSGVSALIKVLLMLQKNVIPPHAGVKTVLNRNFPKDMAERNINIAFKKTPFPRPAGGKRTVFLNNFSAAGGNTAVVLEDGPEKIVKQQMDPRSAHVISVSAKSLAAFKKTLRRFADFVKSNPTCDLADLSYTTTARRNHYNYRIALPAGSIEQLEKSLEIAEGASHNPIALTPPQMAFAYTGQGSQYTAMGKVLYNTSKQFRKDIDEYDLIATQQGFPSFKPLIDGTIDVKDLCPTAVQLGMTCLQMALTRLWAAWGMTPSVVIGHSLGEYAALNAAGVLSVLDTIYLVGKRAELLEQMCSAGTHAMLAIKSTLQSLTDTLTKFNGKVEVACINGVSETVLSGTAADIDAVANELTASGIKSTKLALPFAFHSSQVDPILPAFEKLASSVTFHPPRIPVISPLLSDVVKEDGVFDAQYLGAHCRRTVDFFGSLTAALTKNFIQPSSVWVEIGAHPICSNMIKSTLSASAFPTMRRDEDPWKIISKTVCDLYNAGLTANFNGYHKGFDQLSVLNIPTYGFDEKVYWLQYEGDWTLVKNGVAPAKAATPEVKKFSTTSVQNIVSEKVEGNTAVVAAESDFGDPLLHRVVSGHIMNGVGLCPSSLYADMALGVTEYAYSLLRPGKKVDMNLGTMDNPNPLLLKDQNKPQEQLVQMEVKVDLTFNKADFILTTGEGKARKIHAKCVVVFEDAAQWTAQWQRTAFLVKDRIKMLRKKMEDGDADKIGRKMAYKLFSALVTYAEPFQGMKEVVLDGPELEATSVVNFKAGPQDGSFYLSPYFIDSTAHLSGFIVNSTADPKSIYISHGWESMRYACKLDSEKTYTCYVKMQPAGGKMVAGDVYVFDENDQVVGVVGGLRFQCIPRQLLSTLLPSAPSSNKAKSLSVVTAQPKKTLHVSINEASKKASMPKAQPKAVPKPSGGFLAKAMDLIAAEIEVDQSELADAVQWSDLGVDSLMSLTISGKFREDMDLDVPSTLFSDFPSVGELKSHLSTQNSDADSETGASDSLFDDDSDDSGLTTPDNEYIEIKSARTTASVATPACLEDDGSNIIETIRATIAEEMEIDIVEIAETTDLGSLGMDSLMSLTILGSLREKCDLELDPTIFADNPSLGHLRIALGLEKPTPAPAQAQTHTVREEVRIPAKPEVALQIVSRQPPATSVLLQGNRKTATRNLFLFPDGSGSATSYASIPTVDSKNLCVWGLNCPFMKDPTSFTCGIEGVSKLYLEEVLRRQPTGPYYIGGWSAGGVVAYEVCRQLDEMNKKNPAGNYTVAKLILLDSPCPIRLEPLPARLHHFFDEIGLLGTGTGTTPDWLLPHFEYSIRALTAYKPELKCHKDFQAPPTLLIWATDGVCKNPEDPRPPPQDDDPKSMKWLLNNRADFGPNGWDYLLGAENCSFETISGNHFTMMKKPIANNLSGIIRKHIM